MSKIGNFVLELQEQGALLPENKEPDFLDYAKEYMATEQYAREYADFEKQNIERFIESVKGVNNAK